MPSLKVASYGLSVKGEDHAENEDTILVDVKMRLYAVADGVTVPHGGGLASRLAIQSLRSLFRGDLEDAVKQVNKSVLDEKTRDPTIGSTTLTVAHLANPKIRIAHVGDSCALVIRDDRIILRTLPQIRQGLLTNAIGEYFDPTMISIQERDAGDYIILATDGVTATLTENEILQIVIEEKKPQTIVDRSLREVGRRPREYRDDRSMLAVRI